LSQFFENGVVGEVPLIESNIYVDFGELLREEQQRLLTVLGLFLFNHCFAGIYLAAILLFISMIGAIVITKDTREIITTKNQEGGFQVLISK
jgi:NADH:ubiquinone oxidoreductase subunit 6 (subunit J)